MKKILLSSLMFICTCMVFSQNDFEKGYYIDGQGNRIDGYIKLINFDIVNDSKFSGLDFKTNLNDKSGKIEMQNINEFGFDNQMKMVKNLVEMDDVSFYKDYNDQRDLNLKYTTVFLKVLLEGNPSLYAYPSENGNKYLMKGENDKSPVQLVYKKYVAEESVVKENNKFREQLFKTVKTDDQVFNDFLNIKYEEKDLMPFFEKYNKSKNIQYKVYSNKFEKNLKFNITAFAGLNIAIFKMTDINPSVTTTTDIMAGTNMMFGLGGEVELLLPSEKWAFFTKVGYGSVNIDSKVKGNYSDDDSIDFTDIYNLDAKFIDFVLGPRWYLNFKNKNKFLIGTGIGLDFPSGKLTKTHIFNGVSISSLFNDDLRTNMYFNVAFGYVFNHHYGVDFTLDTPKNLFQGAPVKYGTNFTRIGMNFRYTFN